MQNSESSLSKKDLETVVGWQDELLVHSKMDVPSEPESKVESSSIKTSGTTKTPTLDSWLRLNSSTTRLMASRAFRYSKPSAMTPSQYLKPIRPMRVLIACESSGEVRNAFRRMGHEAWSCDLLPADDGSQFHIQGDALAVAYDQPWDLMIAHPPCTYLCSSGLWRLLRNTRAGSLSQRKIKEL